jgi:hypothetical protein
VDMKVCFALSFFVLMLDVALLLVSADGMEPSRTPCLIFLTRVLCVDEMACALTWQGGGTVLDRIE